MSLLELGRAPKACGLGVHRVVSAAQTLRRVRPLLHAVGVTRVADITGMDRIGIPAYSAVLPDSKDVLSVYNGKGVRKIDAQVGAVMEAIERYSALGLEQALERGSYAELSRHRRVLHPRAVVLGMHPEYDDSKELAWVTGTDLMDPGEVLVPAQAVQILFDDALGHPCYTFSTTNGLASGNTLEEAVCHALCELVERDAWTLAKLLVQYLPRARAKLAGDGATAVVAEDDVERYPCIDPSDAGPTVGRLLRRFERAGLSVLLRDVTSDLGIPVVLATLADELSGPEPMAHFGLGAHPDADVALVRALTEVAQSRATDIQAVREDLAAPGASAHPFASHTRRVKAINRASWFHRPSSRRRRVSELPTHRHLDVLDDIQLMLQALRSAGLGPAVAVDLTRRELGVPVVRVLVGGAESWAADDGRLGQRALAKWRENGGQLWTEP